MERCEWFPLSGEREHAVFGGGLQMGLRLAHPRGISSRVLTSLDTGETVKVFNRGRGMVA